MNVRWDIHNDCWVFKIVRLVNFPSSPVFRLPLRPLGITSVIATRQWWCEASHDPAAPTVARHTEIRRSLVLMEHTWRMPSSVRIGEHFRKKWEVGGFWMVLIPLIVQKSCYDHLGCIKMLYQRVRIFLVFRFEWNRPVPFDWWVGNAKKWTEDSKATLFFCFSKKFPWFNPKILTSPNLLGGFGLCQDACARSFYCQRFTYYIDSKASDELGCQPSFFWDSAFFGKG